MRTDDGGGMFPMLMADRANEARTALTHAALAAEIAAQRARSVALALEEALAVLNDAEGIPPVVATPPDASALRVGALSPREREVLALVAEGRTNKAIAAALYLSPNTVKTHVASLLTKLQADTRTQLAAMAARLEVPSRHDKDGLRLPSGRIPQTVRPLPRS